MPKDFVGRLQDLENEMKTVLSICDETNHGINSNKRMQKRIQTPVRCSSRDLEGDNGGEVHEEENEISTDVEAGDIKSQRGISQKKCPCEKPDSAPGQLSMTRKEEIDQYSKRKRFSGYSPTASRKSETVESVESLEWFDCPTQNYEAEETPGQPLRSAEEILTDISQYGGINDYLSKRSTIWCATCRRRTFDCICRGKRCTQTDCRSCENNVLEDDDDESKESFIHHIKPGLQENPIINELARKIEKKEMEAKSSMNMNIKKTLKNHRGDHIGLKQRKDTQNGEKDGFHKYNQVNGHNEGVGVSLDEKKIIRPATAPAKTRKMGKSPSFYQIIDRNEPRKRNRSVKNSTGREFEKKSHIKLNLHLIPEEQQSESGNSGIKRQTLHCRSEGNVKNIANEYSSSDAETSTDPKEDLLNLKQKINLSDATTRNIAEIIEENHEKIEKMRRSKSLALHTVKIMKEKYQAMEKIKNELTGKFEKLLEKNEELVRELKETDESKQQLIQEWESYKRANSSTNLLNRLQIVNEENLQFKEKIKALEQQLQENMHWSDEKGNNGLMEKISETNQDECYEYHTLCRRQEAAYRRFVQGIAVLENVIKNNKEKEKKLSDIKAELKRRAAKTQSYLERLASEKMELMHMVNELQMFVEERQSKIDELHEDINQKDEELERQRKLLEEKSENLEDTNRELESIRKSSLDLEDQVKTLRRSIENFDQTHQNLLKERQSFENTVKQIKEENSKLQEQLTNEKESLQIKTKIIEDQQETIKQLKEKSDELKTMMGKVQSLERLINIEREEKLELQETAERLRRKKDELKQKVKSLEEDLLQAPQEFVRDLQKTQIVLHELENQVQIKQKEWEMLLQTLVREKDQACNAAAFATKKLIQTTNDFQRHSDTQKKLYRILTENLMGKRKQFNDYTEKSKQTVRFSDDLLQSSFDSEQRSNAERHRLHHKQMGILKKNREWCPN